MPLSYCAEIVRDHDYDRYLCTLFAPVDVREAWFTLFAFNHEVAIIAEIVSEDMIGFIRLAWWREALDEIYAGKPVRNHPVALALAQVVREYDLPRAPFDALLVARAFDLEEKDLATFAELESYARDTSATLFQLCALVAGIPVTPLLDELGIAYALIGIARAQQKHSAIPMEEFLSAAERHLKAIRPERGKSLRVFAPFMDSAEFYLKRLRSKKNPKNPHGERLKLLLTLWIRYLSAGLSFLRRLPPSDAISS